jgi:hypothetical protein
MAKERILIVAKTYPTPSAKYDELVCTAGIRKDGSWVRLYPIPFRKLDYEKRYKKFCWIEADIERNLADKRPESFKIKNHDSITIKDEIPTDREGSWHQRRKALLNNVYTNKAQLIEDAYNPQKCTSLAVFRPSKITGFKIEEVEREWSKSKLEAILAHQQQVDLFSGVKKPFDVATKIPYAFSYEFLDDKQQKSTLQIIDWEIGMLYLNCVKRAGGNEQKACDDVRKKYWDDFVKTKDTHLILGTTLEHHNKNAPNPFLIIGVFAPKHQVQIALEL